MLYLKNLKKVREVDKVSGTKIRLDRPDYLTVNVGQWSRNSCSTVVNKTWYTRYKFSDPQSNVFDFK